MAKKVLVVDDSKFMRNRLIAALSEHGAEVIGEAKDGNEAIRLYQVLRPDLVTMDVTMRGKDGLTASREILESDPEANIVMVTIMQDAEYEKIARSLGVKGFIVKSDFSGLKIILDQI